jgi:hypothetical protein
MCYRFVVVALPRKGQINEMLNQRLRVICHVTRQHMTIYLMEVDFIPNGTQTKIVRVNMLCAVFTG